MSDAADRGMSDAADRGRALGGRLREVFDVVADAAPAERAALLEDLAAGDAALQADVRSLLSALDDADERLERGVPAVAGMETEPSVDATGRRISAYRLIRRIGTGGMGDVYLAERADGEYTQQVAVKLIRPGLATETVVRRFRQERQILAGLRHPAIACLLDGGVTPEGRPYFVMEYVEGVPITAYCAERSLPVGARIRLFRDVCAAVQYAHQNLVVHRDLKPANILVTATGQVKLLDFGVAKLLRAHDTPVPDAAPETQFGAHAFTPSYASVEQIRGDVVTTASDIYSLGVILYELLAGRLPFDVPRGSPADVLQAVSTADPTRPSHALAAARADAQPGPDPALQRELRRRLTGDLDNIVLKTLHREPARRYASADALSEDLRRYLTNMPVLARPDTVRYRAVKFMGRNRTAVVAATAFVIVLLAGAAGTISQAQRARTEQALAVQRLRDLRDVANSLLFDVHDAVAELPGATEARRMILQRGFERLEEYALQMGSDAEVRWELAEAYLRIGLVQGQPTGASLGDLEGAARSYTRAMQIAQVLVDGNAADLRAARTLALTHEKLGDVQAWTGSVDDGVAHAATALGMYRRIAQRHADSTRHQLSLAISLVKLGDLTGHPVFPNLGRPDESIGHYAEALAVLERPPLSVEPDRGTRRYHALVQERLGMMHRLRGRWEDAAASFTQSLQQRVALLEEEPVNVDARRDVAVTHQNLCEVELAQGHRAEALPHCERALARYEELHASDPRNAQAITDVALGARSLAGAQAAAGDSVAALHTLERGIDVLDSLVAAEPDNVPNRLHAARLHAQHTLIAWALRRPAPHAHAGWTGLAAVRTESTIDDMDLQALAALEQRLGRTLVR